MTTTTTESQAVAEGGGWGGGMGGKCTSISDAEGGAGEEEGARVKERHYPWS
jgi:hypothetical protein